MLSKKEYVNINSKLLGKYLRNKEDEWLKSVKSLIKGDGDPELQKEIIN